MKFIPVEGHRSLARDARSGAIVNINSNEIEQARAVKALRRRKDDETEIKSILNNIIDTIEDTNHLNVKQLECYNIAKKGKNILITGSGGCGKSTILKSRYVGQMSRK